MDYSKLLLTASVVLLTYWLGLGIYRVWLSPTAHVPGPTLAKLTYWYEFYWDVIKVGQYTFHIRDLHDKYGPIICLNPHEVHIDDPDFYDEIFVSASAGRKRNRWGYLMSSFGIDDSTFSTLDHDLHRLRRAALSPFFSKAKVHALQERIERIITKLLVRMQEFKDSQQSMSIGIAFTSLTHDVASSYAIDQQDFRIDAPDFAPDFHFASEKLEKSTHLMKQFPWLLKLIQAMPVTWVMTLDPNLGAIMQMHVDLQKQTRDVQTAFRQRDYKPPERTTIMHALLESTQIPESEKSHARLWSDTEAVIVAGTITTAATLCNLFFFLLSDPKKLRRVRAELFGVIPDKNATLRLPALEKLVYLTACIREALRVSNGLSSRIQRIDPKENIVFRAKTNSPGYAVPVSQDKTYVIAPGTSVSMTQLLTHFNPQIYPAPRDFVPERWLEKDVSGTERIHHRLDKYYVPFSRGMRACVGINLAESELYLVTAMVFRRYGSRECQMPGDDGYLELFDSSYERDIEIIQLFSSISAPPSLSALITRCFHALLQQLFMFTIVIINILREISSNRRKSAELTPSTRS